MIDEYTDSTGKLCYRILKNKFNFIDRAVQTLNNPSKDAPMQTEPPAKLNYSDYVNSYILYEAYVEDHKLQVQTFFPKNYLVHFIYLVNIKIKIKERKFNRIRHERVQTAQAARRKRAPPIPEHQEKKVLPYIVIILKYFKPK